MRDPAIITDKILIIGAIALLSAASMTYGYYSEASTRQEEVNYSYIDSGISDKALATFVSIILQH